MCGGGSKKAAPAPAPVTPQYSYYPESARNPQQQAAGVVATGAQSNAGFGSELSTGTPAATTTAGAT